MVSENLVVLKKQEIEINHCLSEITLNINELKNLLDSNDAKLLSKYKFRNAEFRTLPSKLVVSLSHFSSQRIDTDKLFQQFGSLKALSITTEECLNLMISDKIDISPDKKPTVESSFCEKNNKWPDWKISFEYDGEENCKKGWEPVE